ncbi:unnamed protein product [Cuscuta campestris]|uniref:BHLH domain-containing protein n=1 Tax=Cuscuta campestris TaxID=132261 RepID=A0A484KIG3_9ASTE|nr:unnamed protein product [Cuscuta campestris]
MMGEAYEEEDGFAENLREKLAVAVRDIEWSYAIFWSFSSSQPGVVEWGDGYYNGDIKTRRTVQATEETSVDDVLGLQRTQQLRELYESLLAGEPNPQSKIHSSVALSPEDLTDTEWYFLVCMSFMFNLGQGLPGRALAKNQSIWLCNAHQADSKIFSRSLLAKSASIQTVVCFPYLGGAIELGATDLVSEDLNLIHHIRTSYLDNGSSIVVSKLPDSFPENGVNYDAGDIELDFPPLDLDCDGDNNEIGSPYKHSNDSFLAEEIHAEVSQLQNWRFDDEDIIIGNCIHNNSGNSSDCISQNYVNWHYSEQQPPGIDVHYQSVVSNVLQNSHQLILGPNFSRSGGGCSSSFVTWKKGVSSQSRTGATPQRILKKVLMDVGRMHGCCSRESQKEDVTCRPLEGEETDRSRVLSERRRREKLNERFTILSSLIPTSCKVDKISILDETIEYLKDLERRVREVESHKETFELEERRTRGESCDNDKDGDGNVERPSDNCDANGGSNKGKKSLPRKRKKVGDTGGNSHDNSKGPAKRGVKVDMVDENVTIEMRCFWSDGKLTKIIEALDHLHLVCHGMQSSNSDGILCVTVNAKMEESKATPTALIRQALQRLI